MTKLRSIAAWLGYVAIRQDRALAVLGILLIGTFLVPFIRF